MSLQTLKVECLKYLYQGYVLQPGSLYDISEICREHNSDPHEVGNYLLSNRWIKHQRFLPGQFECSITMAGIQQVAPEYISQKKSAVVSTLGINSGSQSIMEILNFEPADFQQAFDIAKYLEKEGLITALYLPGDVQVELSQEGRDYYDNNAARFQ
jgi:hypothetical protein